MRARQRIKVLWLWESLDQIGGVEVLLLNLARGLDKYRYEITIGVNKRGKMTREFEREGINVVAMRREQKYDWRSFLQLHRLTKKLNIDLIHTHGYYHGLRGRIVGRIRGKPTLCTYHADLRREARSTRVRLTTKATLHLASYVNFVSLGVERSFHKQRPMLFSKDILGKRKFFTIYNGVNYEEIVRCVHSGRRAHMRRLLGIADSEKLITTSGRLSSEKGHRYLIEAMAPLSRKVPDVRLVVIGDGAEKAELKALASALGVERHVIFVGERRDVTEILALSDVYVYQALWGALGLGLLEAMAAGVPVVAPCATGIEEVVAHGENGIVVLPTDPLSISTGILTLLENPAWAQKLAGQAANDVAQKFSLASTISSYAAIYNHLGAGTV